MSDPARSQFDAEAAAQWAGEIRRVREWRGLTQLGLAERMGVSQSLVSRWEDPAYRGWTLKTLLKIADALRARLRVEIVDESELGSSR